MTALIVGTLLALGALAFVLYPLFAGASPGTLTTGPVCAKCGPRPEEDARFCSSCGAPLAP